MTREEKTMDAIVIALTEAINHYRPLTEPELDWLEAAVRREERRKGRKREMWTRSDVTRLKRYLRRGKKVRHIAPLMGKSEGAIWAKLRELPELRGTRGTNQHRRKPRQGPIADAAARA